MLFSVIDPKCLFDAESSLKDYFKSNKIDFKNTNELIALNKIEYEKATKHYKLIKNSYIGCYMEMQDKIDKLERLLKDKQNEYNLTKEKMGNELVVKDKDYELVKQQFANDITIKDRDFELLKEKHHHELSIREKDKTIKFTNVLMQLKEEKHKNENTIIGTSIETINTPR